MGNRQQTQTNSSQPSALEHGRRIESPEEFWNIIRNGQWYAVWRPDKQIYHHFMISEASPTRDRAKVIHYTGTAKRYFESFGKVFGEVVEDTIYRGDKDLLDIPNNLFIVCDPRISANEEAVARARKRIGERQYSMAYNNCEHFVNFALTGQPGSNQYDRANVGKKMAALLIDEAPRLLTKCARDVLVGFVSAVRNNVAWMLTRMTTAALPALGIASVAINGMAALAEAIYEAYELEAQVDEGTMSRRDCDNAKAKRIAVEVTSIVFSIVGSVLGQVLLPIPSVGFIVGGIVGHFVGSFFGGLIGRIVGAIGASIGTAIKEKCS